MPRSRQPARRRRRPSCPARSARARAAIAGLLCVLLLSGCGRLGAAGEDLPQQDARLLLDAPPSGVHAGIYVAASRGYDRGEGITLRLRRAGRRDAARLLERERVDAAVMDIHELVRVRRRGDDVVGVMAFVQRPLTGIIAEAGVSRPADLDGRRVAIGRDPAEPAVLKSIVGDGGLVRVEPVRTGRGVEALLSGEVDGVTARWDVQGVEIAAERPGVSVLRVDEHGAPRYPQLVLAVKRYTLDERANVVRALIRTLQRGYREARIDPESAAAAMLEREPRTERELLLAQISEVAPAWTAGASAFGELDAAELREWARWAVEHGALSRRPDLGRAFELGLVTSPRAS